MEDKLETIKLEGVFGSDLNFDVFPLDSKLDHVPCVYFLSRAKNGSSRNSCHEIIYFGHTDDLSSCIKVFRNLKCFDSFHPDCVGIHREDEEEERILLKSSLIKKYNPKLAKVDF